MMITDKKTGEAHEITEWTPGIPQPEHKRVLFKTVAKDDGTTSFCVLEWDGTSSGPNWDVLGPGRFNPLESWPQSALVNMAETYECSFKVLP